MPTSTKRRTRLGPADGVRVKQSPTLDYPKLPIHDNAIPLLITGGEALRICEEYLAQRIKERDERQKLWKRVSAIVRPKRGYSLPKGMQVKLDNIGWNHLTVRISFHVPNAPNVVKKGQSRIEARRKVVEEAGVDVRNAYGKWVSEQRAIKLNSAPFDVVERGVITCKVAYRHDDDLGKKLKQECRGTLNDLRPSFAERVLAVNGNFNPFRWGTRIEDQSGPPIPMRVPNVEQLDNGKWILFLPASNKNIPQDIYLPRGTFKRLTMSQYWKLREAAAVGE